MLDGTNRLKELQVETEDTAERLAASLDRDAPIRRVGTQERPYVFLITEDELSTVLSNADGVSIRMAPYDETRLVDSTRLPARIVNGAFQFFYQEKKRHVWRLQNHSILSHPWVHLLLLLAEVALLADLIWFNTLDALPVMAAFAITWGFHSVFKNPDEVQSARQAVFGWLGRMRGLPFYRPSAHGSVAIVATLALVLGTFITQSVVAGTLGFGTAASSGGHAAVDTINPSTTAEAAVLLTLFALFGVAEEVVFRHNLQLRSLDMTLHSRVWIAGVAFGVAHTFVYGLSAHAFSVLVAISIAGALMGYAYELTDNLTVPAAVHALNNVIAVGILLASSGS